MLPFPPGLERTSEQSYKLSQARSVGLFSRNAEGQRLATRRPTLCLDLFRLCA